MFQVEELPLAGACLLTLPCFEDVRGSFVKTFQGSVLEKAGIDFDLKESYFSLSARDAIRGMHFQTPPHDHAKIVFCPLGAILDVIVDLRKGSGTYGQAYHTILSAENHKAFYIPKGFAHGFKSMADGAMTYYLVSSEHSKEHDCGILYSSIGVDWYCPAPIVSVRDQSFVALKDFESPF
ncbi:MAG: dTDP-4-dehydrorhamnose 3,5-epimerase family protein [Edaphocola sp.]